MAELFCVVVGVSRYLHLAGGTGAPAARSFGLKQLSSTAISALSLFEWLEAAALPGASSKLSWTLASPTLLVSPSPDEVQLAPRLLQFPRASRANFAAAMHQLRDAASARPDAATLVFFAGHGVQRSNRDGLMLLDDFGDPATETFANAAELTNLIDGMAPSAARPAVARTQLWWLDACRVMPTDLDGAEQLTAPNIFDVARPGVDDRSSPVFFATLPGAAAAARKKRGTFFSKALIRGLSGAAAATSEVDLGMPRWQVSIQSLSRALQNHFRRLAEEDAAQQVFVPDGPVPRDVVIAELTRPPNVDLEVQLDPSTAGTGVSIEIQDEQLQPIVHPGAVAPVPQPYVTTLEAGVYSVHANATAPLVSARGRAMTVKPPHTLCIRKVTP